MALGMDTAAPPSFGLIETRVRCGPTFDVVRTVFVVERGGAKELLPSRATTSFRPWNRSWKDIRNGDETDSWVVKAIEGDTTPKSTW
jgi:hypothetical protein